MNYSSHNQCVLRWNPLNIDTRETDQNGNPFENMDLHYELGLEFHYASFRKAQKSVDQPRIHQHEKKRQQKWLRQNAIKGSSKFRERNVKCGVGADEEDDSATKDKTKPEICPFPWSSQRHVGWLLQILSL